MKDMKRAMRAVFTWLMSLLLLVGLVPVLPEAPYALAEDAGVAVELGENVRLSEMDSEGSSVSVVGDAPDDGAYVDGDASVGQTDGTESLVLEDTDQGYGYNDVQGLDVQEGSGVHATEAEDAAWDGESLPGSQSVSVSNPRVVADSSMKAGQVATWDCVWFGSYPQTEVASGDAAYAALQGAAWDANGDAIVGGARYRRISPWSWTPDEFRFFRYEPIKWRVLEVSGTTAIVVADRALDSQRYNTNEASVTWATSSVRSWLNGYGASSNQPGEDFSTKNFIGTAFSSGESSVIMQTNVTNEDNMRYGTAGGNDTIDSVFLLSESEVFDTSYGFTSNYLTHGEVTLAQDEARYCKVSDYAGYKGATYDTKFGYERNCYWWLRSPGSDSYNAASVGTNGQVYSYNYDGVSDRNHAVRPALKLNLSSTYVLPAGTVSSNGAVDEQAAPGGGASGDDVSSSDVKVSFNEATYEWTGKPIEPPALITHGSKVLTPGIDYVASYTDNVNVGIATATFTGIGSYSGSVSKKFMIVYSPKRRKGRDCSYIVGRVREYTSGNMKSQFDAIGGVGIKSEEQFRQLHEFFVGKGFLNARDGVAYLRDTVRQRRAYDALICDDVFIAHQYYWWLNNTFEGGRARASLFATDYIFNAKYSGYVNLPALAHGETPNVKKCKDLLYDFMDDMGREAIKADYAEYIDDWGEVSDMVSETSDKVTDAGKEYADSLLRQLENTKTSEETQAVLRKCNELGVFKTLEQEKSVFTYKLSDESGFGKFAKAMGKGIKTFSCLVETVEDIVDLVTLDAHIKCYMTYINFLDEVAQATDLPLQMRCAAAEIKADMDLGPWAKVRDIAFRVVDTALEVGGEMGTASITKGVLDSARTGVLGEGAASSVASWLLAVQISAWGINMITDVGSLAKGSDLVEGYEKLCAHYKGKLTASWDDFTVKETDENAWRFFENYNMLWQLRVKGEKAYFKMMDVGGVTKFLIQEGTQLKKEAVNESLARLGEMAFVLEKTDGMPDSAQFAKYSKSVKLVVDCPVDVDVYDPAGKLVCTMRDGAESEVVNSHGTFVVTYRAWTGEWAKAAFVDSGGYRLVARSRDEGLVSMKMMTGDDKQNVWSTDNIKVGKSSKVELSVNAKATTAATKVDADGDGTYESSGDCRRIGTSARRVTGVKLDKSALSLSEGESVCLGVTVAPGDAACQDVRWVSLDEGVATVRNGKVTGVSAGKTSVMCVSEDKSDVTASCQVEVAASHGRASFSDVTDKVAHHGDIAWLASEGISEGWAMPDGTRQFRPYASIARADMAAFLFRLARQWGLADDSWRPSAEQRRAFSDVTERTPHAREIWWLAANGISNGTRVGDVYEFRPYEDVIRRDMAAFLFRLSRLDGRGGAVTGWEPTTEQRSAFADVGPGTIHATSVWWLASTGVSEGWAMPDGTRQFRPASPVARADMAAFLHRLDGLGA